MSILNNNNSYMTVNEATKLLEERILSADPIRQYWDNLTETDKAILIVSTTEKYDIEAMLYKGRKVDVNQSLQFPRLINNKVIECPTLIKIGLLMQGIKENMSINVEEEKLKEIGVKSFADGSGARIEFKDSDSKNDLGLYKDIWTKYFRSYSLIC